MEKPKAYACVALVNVPSITFMDQMETGSHALDFRWLPPILQVHFVSVTSYSQTVGLICNHRLRLMWEAFFTLMRFDENRGVIRQETPYSCETDWTHSPWPKMRSNLSHSGQQVCNVDEEGGKKRRRKAVNEKQSKHNGKAYAVYAIGNMAAPRLMLGFHFSPHTNTDACINILLFILVHACQQEGFIKINLCP